MITAKKALEISMNNSAEHVFGESLNEMIMAKCEQGEMWMFYKVPHGFSISQLTHFFIKYGYSVSIQSARGDMKISWANPIK